MSVVVGYVRLDLLHIHIHLVQEFGSDEYLGPVLHLQVILHGVGVGSHSGLYQWAGVGVGSLIIQVLQVPGVVRYIQLHILHVYILLVIWSVSVWDVDHLINLWIPVSCVRVEGHSGLHLWVDAGVNNVPVLLLPVCVDGWRSYRTLGWSQGATHPWVQ